MKRESIKENSSEENKFALLKQELEEIKRELEIEASLERVRTVAMGMKEPSDMVQVCKVISDQLELLRVSNIRNVQTAIIDEQKGTYLNYQFFAAYKEGTTEETDFNQNLTALAMIREMKKSSNSTFQGCMEGDELDTFRKWRRQDNQFPDPIMDKVDSLNYYFYSIGLGGLGLTTYKPLPEDGLKIFKRFHNVFTLAYRRFKDIEIAVAQAREAEIELALEKVRARTMGMQKSDELKEVIQLLYEQFVQLNIHVEHAGFIMDYNTRDDMYIWLADKNAVPFHVTIPYFDCAHWNSFVEAKEKGKSFFVNHLTFEEKNKFYEDLFKLIPDVPEETIKYYLKCPGLAISTVLMDNVGLYIENFDGIPYSPNENNTLMRFGKVFQQTYTRFRDLEKAEAQAREARVEAALERVRSLALGMRKSEEVGNVTDRLFKELTKLSVDVKGCSIVVIDENSDKMELWRARSNVAIKPFESTSFIESMNLLKKNMPDWFPTFFKALEKRKNYLLDELSDERRSQFINVIAEQYNYSSAEKSQLLKNTPEKITTHYIFFKLGYLALLGDKKLSDENLLIVRRFIEVFEFSYTRFLDIKKAEEQAREAKIEASLERVRSRTMAMHKSDELADTAGILFEQMVSLGINPKRCVISIINQQTNNASFWLTSSDGKVIPGSDLVPLTEEKHLIEAYRAWKEKKEHYSFKVSGEERLKWTQYVIDKVKMHLPEYQPDTINKEQILSEPAVFNCFNFSHGFIMLHTVEDLTDEQKKMIKRFAGVFEQTYTRFLDLKRAEEQAREAKIETSLERVRSKAMSMHSSEDLASTIDHFFHELKSLNVKPIRCGVGIKDGDSRTVDVTVTSGTEKGEDIKLTGKLTLGGHPILDKVYKALQRQAEYFPVLRGKEINDYYQAMNPDIEFPNFTEDDVQYGYYFHYEEGGVFAWTEKELLEEEINIFRKFKSVLSLTYRRYIELKEAEVRSVEAVRQASLDRVRAEIASMRTAEDLNRITPIVWRELKNLEVPFFRCGVFIVDENNSEVLVYLTTPDGKSLGVLNLPFNVNELTTKTVDYWKKKKVYKEHWNKEEFINWTKSMIELGQIQNEIIYQGSATPPESLDLHFVPFTQGMLYVGDTEPLTDEKLDLVKTLAEAFSIAYARYEDFRNLEEAKNKIETTLSELRSAQTQLIHSEKMASLGELTAGIAHEIKNPLNFVNNFSEVSKELLDEMKVEIDKKNIDEIIEIVELLKDNLKKINHHGKRADSIVKGMLLHSRGSSGEKVLTNINDLLDQYVMLAYHGMRAQDKDFNITIEKDYDQKLEKLNVIPQDLSRVFLNIINNACYACNERNKTAATKHTGTGYSPTLKVATKNLQDEIEISIRDNGNGIPDSIKNQIFNPFFSTKPTGEGTGLGLSLSYDIITKVHGGEIKYESVEGEFTKFIISLPKV